MPVVVLVWISFVLLVDADGSLWTQRLLGAATWILLALLLRRETPLVRVQTVVVVVFATVVEYTFSPLLEVYLYRFDNVPAYVPPGHGLVYLAALGVGRTRWVQTHARECAALALAVGGTWAAWGVLGAEQTDVLGALWFCCLAGFLLWGPNTGLYVGAFLVVSYLEIVGTTVGTWAWQPVGPLGIIPIGNPPSGAAGGYGWFDLAAVLLAPALLARWRSVRRRVSSPEAAGSPAGAGPGRPGRDRTGSS